MTQEELDFHLSLMEHLSQDERKVFRRRLDISEFQIPELAGAFDAIRKEINSRWNLYAKRIKAPVGNVALYLDYIDSSAITAVTFGRQGTYFIGITDKMLATFAKSAEAFWRVNTLAELLEIDWNESARNFLFEAVLLIQLQFISSHELGHLVHGHIDQEVFREEFTSEVQDLLDATDKMPDQAREVEADGYAVHMLLNNLVKGKSGPFIYQKLRPRLPFEDFILTLLLLSVAGSFFFLNPKKFDPMKVRKSPHPFDLARMNGVLYELIAWCKLNKPGLERWASLPRFQWVMACVQQAADSREQGESWIDQGNFLKSAEGQKYMDDLYAEQKKLRQEMTPRRWEIGEVEDNEDNNEQL